MTFLAGEIAARLRLEGKAAFDAGLVSSGQKFSNLDKLASRTNRAIDTGTRTAATAFGALTVGIAATTAGVFAQGAAYNVLQQNSRVALGTLLGGAEKANAQMDKLDAFAKQSPFSKSTFIQAQQQMIGFGIETEKVIPYLDAIQNQVAAIGGSNQDISDITAIVAKIRSSATLGQEDLNQLADRGINAAKLIAEANGQTEQEFRDSIMGSPIKGADALKGLDAMLAAMDKKFAGTTGKIKEQWTGAADRIKAATRDIGASLAMPFIDPAGGGQAVVWGNQVADVLRAVEKQTKPLTDWAMSKLGPSFQTVSDVLIDLKGNIAGLDLSQSNIDTQLSRLSTYAPGIGLVAGGLAAMGTNIPILARLGLSINPVVGGILGLVAASPELRAAGGDMVSALQPLLPLGTRLAAILGRQLANAMPLVVRGVESAATVVEGFVGILEGAPEPVLALVGVSALLALGLNRMGVTMGATTRLSGMLAQAWQRTTAAGTAAAVSYTQTGAAATLAARGMQLSNQGAILGSTSMRIQGAAATTAATGLNLAAVGAGKLGTALKVAFLGNPVGLALTVITTAVGFWAAANADAEAKVASHKQAVADFRSILGQANGDIENGIRQQAARNLVTDETVKSLSTAGISEKTYLDAVTGSGRATEQITQQLVRRRMAQVEGTNTEKEARKVADEMGVSYETVIGASLGVVNARNRLTQATKANSDSVSMDVGQQELLFETLTRLDGATGNVATSMSSQARAISAARDEQAAYERALAESVASMSDAEVANRDLNAALATIRDTSAAAADRLSAIKTALDLLKGGAQTAAEAERDLHETTDKLTAAFTAQDEAGNNLAKGLVDQSGKIDTTSEAGRRLFDEVGSLNDQMITAQQLAYDHAKATGDGARAFQLAQDAAKPYQDALQAAGEAAGLSTDQIDGMKNTLLATPAITAFLISDNGSIDEADQGLIELAQQIEATPDKTVTIDEPLSAAVRKRLIDLGYTIMQVPGSKEITVTAPGGKTVADILAEVDRNAQNRTKTVTTIFRQIGQQMAINPDTGKTIPTSANGNVFDGGKIQAFANGGMPTGIYKAGSRPLYKFAEPETRWEAFISGKIGQEDRNRRIVGDVADRLGLAVVEKGKQREAFANGGFTAASRNYDAPSRVALEPVRVRLEVTVDDGGMIRVVQREAGDAARDVIVELIDDATGRR